MKKRKHGGKPEALAVDNEFTKINFSLLASVFFIAASSFFPLYFRRTGYIHITQDKAFFFILFSF